MRRFFRRRTVRIAAAALAIPALVVGAYGFYLANMAGALPWQPDPTRIPITPFADIPGFSVPATQTPTPVRTPTPGPATPTPETASEGTTTTERGIADVGIAPPAVGPVRSLDETIRPDLSMTAVRAG